MEKIVVPGEMLWEKEMRVPNTSVVDGKTYATVLGMVRDDRFIPLELVYKPKPGDNVVGIVTNVRHAGYSIELNLPYDGFISSKFTRVSFQQGDLIYGRVKFVDEVGNADITDAKRLPAGKIVDVPASKVPRIIGKKSSMLNVIRDGTGCSIFVGNNGYIWIGGKGNLPLALKTINFIVANAHKHGLTDKVAEYLNEHGGNVKVPQREEEKPPEEKGGLSEPAEETPEPAKEPETAEPSEPSEGTPVAEKEEDESESTEGGEEKKENPLMHSKSAGAAEESGEGKNKKIDIEEM